MQPASVRIPNRLRFLRIALPVGALLGMAVAGIVLATVLGGCQREQTIPEPQVVPVREAEKIPVPQVHFTDITKKAGIDFVHTSGAFGKKLLPETMGSGVAFLDYDGDGKQDLLFVNSCSWPGHEDKSRPAPTMALYRNKGDGTFEDVTEKAGLACTFYGMGVTVGDYDNDGWPDVFITGVGGNHLFHNEDAGGGRRHFVDVTARAGVGGPGGWPASGSDFLSLRTPLNWSTSQTITPSDLPASAPRSPVTGMPAFSVTSSKVPSPLLRYSKQCVPLNALGGP